MELDRCTALVTGGSGDLGSAIARALGRAGVSVAVAYVGEQRQAERVAAEVTEHGGRGWPVRLDQSEVSMPEEVVSATLAQFGHLDILVNNAAWNIGIPFSDIEALTPEVWDRMYATNVRGPYLLARAAARSMRTQQKGRIVNVASVAGLLHAGSSIAYATSKAALIHLTRCLAVALAPSILVNCVAPGLIEGTRMAQRLPAAMLELARKTAVLERAASPEDIADQVLAFCRSDSVTGQVLPIDCGLFPH